MSDELLDRLDAALAVRDPSDFLGALDGLDPGYVRMQFADRPAPLSWFGSIHHLYWTTDGQGISNYLLLDNDQDFQLALESCRRIGAARMVAYLEAAAAFFPKKRVPVIDQGRYVVVRRLWQKARDMGTQDPFDALDKRFPDAIPSLADDVRAWIVANRAEVDELLRSIEPPAKPAASEVETLLKALATIQAMSTSVQDAKSIKVDALRRAADERGMLPWRDTGLDPRVVRFFAAASQFGQAEWLTVATRALAAPRKFQAADRLPSETIRLIESSDLVDQADFRIWLHRAYAVRNAAVDNARSMPSQVIHLGKPIGLLATANDAIIAVSLCLAIHDWMMLTPEGVKAARVLYGLFNGLAPCPELPSVPRTSRRRAT